MKWSLLFLTLFLLVVYSYGDSIHINRWRCSFSNSGWFINGYWPYPLNTASIFGGGLWVGCVDQGETLVTVGYNPNSGSSEMSPSLCRYWREYDPRDRIYKYPGDWPPPRDRFPMAPIIPLSDMDLWCCFNDSNPARHDPSDTRPIGIDVALTVYGFRDSLAQDFFFLKYELFNNTNYPMNNMHIGIVIDADIRRYRDDFCGLILNKLFRIGGDTIRVKNTGFIYDDSAGIAVAIRFLGNSSGLNLTAFKQLPIENDPRNDRERYLGLAGWSWWTFPPQYAPFDSLDSIPSDKRFLISCGPFNLLPGSTQTFYFAVIGSRFMRTDTTELALQAYWSEKVFRERLGIEEVRKERKEPLLRISPNPFSNKTAIYLSSYKGKPLLEVYNLTGKLIKLFSPNSFPIYWDGKDDRNRRLPKGVYFLKIKTEDKEFSYKLILK